MLAGKMKLRNFLLIVAVVGGAGLVASFLMCSGDDKKEGADRQAARPTPPTKPPVADTRPHASQSTSSDPTPVQQDNANLRDVDRELMRRIGSDLGSEKVKDAAKGHAWKINLYQDAGETSMNRAKVDLDRDDKWDEKWTFDGDNISRKVAPLDDESCTEAYDWNGSEWVRR